MQITVPEGKDKAGNQVSLFSLNILRLMSDLHRFQLSLLKIRFRFKSILKRLYSN
jgi:hypothetical protein